MAWVSLSRRGDIGLSDGILRRNAVALCDVAQQREQALDLHRRKWLVAVIVQLDADRRRVEIRIAAPARLTRVPGTHPLVDELNDPAVAPDQVMRADAACGIEQRAQRGVDAAASGMVDHDEIRSPQIEVRRRLPRRGQRRVYD